MANDHRNRDRLCRPFIPIVDVDVCATDRRVVYLDQHIVRTDHRDVGMGYPQAFAGFKLGQTDHVSTPAERPAAAKAVMAVSMSVLLRLADICVRIRARPCGTTGYENAVV